MRETKNRTLYGRRVGKPLRQYQSSLVTDLLPRLAVDVSAPIVLADIFPTHCQAYQIEIGFGGAEHLLHRAFAQPEVGFIGCEPFVNGVAKALAGIDAEALANVRLHMGDAREVLAQLPDGVLDVVTVLYPDPWPKWRHRTRRFISSETISSMARVLHTGGEVRFATDIEDYAAWTLARFLKHPDFEWQAQNDQDWLIAWDGWPGTRYEAKALREGRAPVYLTFVRK